MKPTALGMEVSWQSRADSCAAAVIANLRLLPMSDVRSAKFSCSLGRAAKDPLKMVEAVVKYMRETVMMDEVQRPAHLESEDHSTVPIDAQLGVSRPIELEAPRVSRRYSTDEQIEFLMEIAVALQAYGEPAHTLEETMHGVASRMRIESSFFVTPTSLYAAFGRFGELHTRMARLDMQRTDLGRMRRINEVASDVAAGKMAPYEGVQGVREIVDRRPRHSSMGWQVGLPATQAGAVAMMLNGTGLDALVSTALGLGTGFLVWAFGRSPSAALLLTFFATLYAAFSSFGLRAMGVPISPYLVTVCAVVAFMPGLTFTTALLELSTRNLVSGTARLMGAFLVLMQLGTGLAFGVVLARATWGAIPPVDAPALWPWWWAFGGATILAMSLYFDFRAARSDFAWILFGCLMTFGTYLALRTMWDVEASIFMAAAMAGVFSEGYARWTGRSLSIALVPSITLLVPGILGFRSVSSLVLNDVSEGLDLGFAMGMTGIALASGVLMATVMFESTQSAWSHGGGAISRIRNKIEPASERT